MSSRAPLWTSGPIELFHHADGHREAGGDTDRRIALIGFDQTIEVAIDAYLTSHERLRGARLEKRAVENARQNFYTRIEFLEQNPELVNVTIDEDTVLTILWCHQLRNELYHSGNGMVPERKVVHAARDGALRVLTALFGDRVLDDLGVAPPERKVVEIAPDPNNPVLVLLSAIVDFERELRALQPAGVPERAPLPVLWANYTRANPSAEKLTDDFRAVLKIRNEVVHGHSRTELDDGLSAKLELIRDLHSKLAGSPPSK